MTPWGYDEDNGKLLTSAILIVFVSCLVRTKTQNIPYMMYYGDTYFFLSGFVIISDEYNVNHLHRQVLQPGIKIVR